MTSNGLSAELYDPSLGMWAATRSLQHLRFHHTATLLPNGKVLAAGGSPGENSTMARPSAELYDPATGTWAITGALSVARRHHTATLLPNGKVLITGGSNSSDAPLASAELYNPATGTFSPAAPMSRSRRYHSATLLSGGQVLVAGGQGSTPEAAASAELYDPATDTWSTTGSLGQRRRYHSATLLPDGKVLAAGGFHESAGTLTGSEVYDPSTGTWSPTDSMNVNRYQHTATLLMTNAVLVTGGFSTQDASSAELYDARPSCENNNPCTDGFLDNTTGACVAVPRPANTNCGTNAICDGQGTCVPSVHSTTVHCGAGTLSGDQLCQSLGFTGASMANGYWWGQCAGTGDLCPGGWQGDGTTCPGWCGVGDCAGETFCGGYWSSRWGPVRERLGNGSTTFTANEFWSCPGWNPGWTVRVRCYY